MGKDEHKVADTGPLTKHFLVQGRVQGVFYRRSTQECAQALGLTGWVRNLTDGRVELKATGTEQQLYQLESWLWRGPERANVTVVECRAQTVELFDTFKVQANSD
ncbi:acylphosphatase [Gilvimarinus agarilyticus]|uniref:acylphosphatase n=1 Tax=unclassified Gilvimarinus TaxID=2642066 RepID=UPI001C0A32D7|nr:MULTISPECIES: acylphosphatase [unclassified Gilvimarinus]MBU2884326.1 acylphosphatase [Gilvimarinus agarilyticus]MDO6569465.1 acylphosphatase [Gilvimarinus sp. 2_MG-2023]MDO6747623.1 acylphosphatase [Gilvimarinus sp. 1_MG-2023]